MNLKSKLFGTLAASAIALSMTGGIVSADDTKTTVGTAYLLERDGGCAATLDQASGFTLGSWQWNGTDYVQVTGTGGVVTLSGELLSASPDNCKVTLGFGGLNQMTGDKADSIGLGYFEGSFESYGPYNLGSVGGTSPQLTLGTGSYEGTLKLTDVPNVSDGTYQGTVTVTIVDVE